MQSPESNTAATPVVIYTKPACGFCHAAIRLLERKPIQFQQIDVTEVEPRVYQELKEQTQHHTVPQIFINENFIGGYDQLYALNASGELDKMLVDELAHNQNKSQPKE